MIIGFAPYQVRFESGSVVVFVPYTGNAWSMEDSAARIAEDMFPGGGRVEYVTFAKSI